ncbi:hypothetical protein MASR1M90_10600 [Desulfovibrionales bacterium]
MEQKDTGQDAQHMNLSNTIIPLSRFNAIVIALCPCPVKETWGSMDQINKDWISVASMGTCDPENIYRSRV